MQTPNMNLSEQAGARASESIGKYGADIEKTLYGMMQNGGMADMRGYLSNAKQVQSDQNAQTIADLKSSGIPLRSTSMAKAAGSSLGKANNEFALGIADKQLSASQQAAQNQLSGASGLMNMGQYYAAPASIEQSMMSSLFPYLNANMQSKQNTENILAQGYNTLANQNYSGIETYMLPSNFDKYVAPILNFAGEALGGALPTLLGNEQLMQALTSMLSSGAIG